LHARIWNHFIANSKFIDKGPVIIYGGGWHRREMFFARKLLLTQPSKSQNIWLPNLKYQLKNKYPPLTKNVTKGYQSVVTHVLYHFCDMSLITACESFCNLKFHIVCTCSFFVDTIALPTNRKIVKIVTLITVYRNALIDSHIAFTYDCWHCFQSPIFQWVVLWKWQYFLLPNPWVVLFFIYPTFYSLKILFTQPFSLRCHPPP
jgi:hypothetical protein